MPVKRKLLTVAEVATVLGVSESLVYSWAEGESPEIPSIRFGRPGCRGTLRFAPSQVVQFVQKRFGGGEDELKELADEIRAELDDD